MTEAPPDPDASREALFEHASRLHARLAEKAVIIAGIRRYADALRSDKRMRVMGDMLLREIERLENETARGTA